MVKIGKQVGFGSELDIGSEVIGGKKGVKYKLFGGENFSVFLSATELLNNYSQCYITMVYQLRVATTPLMSSTPTAILPIPANLVKPGYASTMNLCRMSGVRMYSGQWKEMIDVLICCFTAGLAMDGHDCYGIMVSFAS